jgi:tRNA threonylcarbamoyladenosine biosynthesis protein TsaE
MELIFQLPDIDKAAGKVLKWLAEQGGTVLALSGSMGAGKTTFTAAMLRVMGSKDVANSPTFSIINQYTGRSGEPVYHLDLYRLKDEEEALQAGIEECLFSGNLCVVEWPEKAASLMPEDAIFLHLMINDDGSRLISTEIP